MLLLVPNLLRDAAAALGLPRVVVFFFSSRRRHTRCLSDWSSDVCSSDLGPVHREDRDEHHQDDQGGADGPEQAGRRQETAAHLAEAGRQREEHARPEPEALEEPGGASQAVPAEPPEELLRSVRAQREPDHEPRDQQPGIHGVSPLRRQGFRSSTFLNSASTTSPSFGAPELWGPLPEPPRLSRYIASASVLDARVKLSCARLIRSLSSPFKASRASLSACSTAVRSASASFAPCSASARSVEYTSASVWLRSSISCRRRASSLAFASASLTIRSTSCLLSPDEAVIVICCCLPEALSCAVTFRMPLASMSNATSIWGTPRGAGGMPSRRKRPSVRLSFASGRSPCRTWISTAVWLSAAVLKTSLFLVGMVVLRGIKTVMAPPRVSTPSDSGVTSSSTTSLTSPARTPPWMAAPTATTSSGFTPLCASLPKSCLTCSWTFGMRVCPPTRTTSSMSAAVTPASFIAWRHGPTVRSMRSATSDSSLARVSVITRCLGPVWSAVMNGRLISVWRVELSSIFAFSAASFKRCSAMRSRRRSTPLSFLNSSAIQSITRWSKSSPPRCVSPLVALTSKTPWPISRIEMSNVPPPRSYTAICSSVFLSSP